MAFLKVNALTKIFPTTPTFLAVDNISFELKEAEILGILGPNGAGKTTTLQMLLGILTPSSGSIEYFNKDFKRFRSQVLQKISFASTYVNLPHSLTVEQSLNVFCRLYGISSREAKRRIQHYLELFGVAHKKKSLATSLSAGQITRVMLAKAFMTEPKLLLLDEPTASLDPDISKDVLELILKLRSEKGLSILFTSHNMAEVSQVCDRLLFMQQGKIIADDIPEKLAKSVKKMSLELLVVDGLKRAVQVAKEMGCAHRIEHRLIQIDLNDEKEIAALLRKLAAKEVFYSDIHIIKPTLEDYFLEMSKKGAKP